MIPLAIHSDVVIVADATPDRDFFEPGGAAVRAFDSNGLYL